MAYTVTAPLVIGKNDEGGDLYLYEGAPVPSGQSKDWVKTHLAAGMISSEETSTAEPPTDDRPAGNASREEWEAYATAHGRTIEELADLSRNDIRDLFGP